MDTEELTHEEREKISYLIRGLGMYANQLAVMLNPTEFENVSLRHAAAHRGDGVIEVIQEVQALLKNRGGN